MATPARADQSLLERKSTLWFLATLACLLFAITNLPWQLDDYDQAKQAFTSFEMVNEGHWFYQHTPNEKIATKPPLIGWVSAACYGVTRSWELSWRLPSIAAALLLLFSLTRAATRKYGAAAAVLAMSAFGLNLLTPRLATLVRTDMPLALFIFLIGLAIWKKVATGEAWQTRDRVWMFALLTATMLIKGPIVYAFLLPGLVVFQWRRRKIGGATAWCGWSPWIASLALFLVWAAGGIVSAPGFYEQVVLREFVGRFSETVHRAQPFYFYLPHLLHKFAPWSVLLIGFAVLSWRAEKLKLRERWRRLSPDTAWLLCWSLGGLLVMSLVPSKRVDRIFPVIPPLCLLLAAMAHGAWSNQQVAARARRWSAFAVVFACLFSAGYTAQRVIGSYRAGDSALVQFGASVRREALAHGWRYEVIGREEEGLLLYLRRTHFVKTADAVRLWNGGELQAIVAPEAELPSLLKQLPDGVASSIEGSIQINGRQRRYVLITNRS